MLITQIIGLMLVIILGYMFISLFISRIHFIEKVALGFLSGWGLFTFAIFLIYWKLQGSITLFSSMTILTVLLVIVLIANKLLRKTNKKIIVRQRWDIKNKFKQLSKIEKVFTTFILILFCASLLINFYWPVMEWDSITLYDFRARVLLEEGSMVHTLNYKYYFGYPLFTSLAHYWLYALKVSNPMFFYGLIYISMSISFYFLMRRLFPRVHALGLTLFFGSLSTIFNHSLIAYTNLLYTAMFSLGCLYAYFWIKEKNTNYVYISMLFISLSTWTRSSEPFWLIPIFVSFIVAFKYKQYLAGLIYAFTVILVRGLWLNFRSEMLGYDSPLIENITSITLDKGRLIEVFNYLYDNLVIPYKLFLIIFILSVLLAIKARLLLKKSNLYLASLIIGIILSVYAGVYIISFSYEKWELVGGSITRMVFFIIPLITFFSAVILKESFDQNKT